MGRKSKAEERKLEILGHLYSVIRDLGLEGASVGNVAARMDVNPSLIIHYFKTKEEMMVEMVDFLLSKYEETYLTQIEKLAHPQDRIEFALDAVFGVEWLEVTDPKVHYACYYLSYHNERVRARFAHMHDWFRELLVAEINSLDKQQNKSSGERAAQIADLIIVLNEGITYLYGISYDRNQYIKRGKFLKALVTNMLKEQAAATA